MWVFRIPTTKMKCLLNLKKFKQLGLADTKMEKIPLDPIYLDNKQRDWLRTLMTWLKTRGERKRNWMLAIPVNWIDSIDEEIKNKMLTDGGLSELSPRLISELSPATLNENPAVKKSDKIVWVYTPHDMLQNILNVNYYWEGDKTDLNLLGIAYLWYKKEGIKWNGH